MASRAIWRPTTGSRSPSPPSSQGSSPSRNSSRSASPAAQNARVELARKRAQLRRTMNVLNQRARASPGYRLAAVAKHLRDAVAAREAAALAVSKAVQATLAAQARGNRARVAAGLKLVQNRKLEMKLVTDRQARALRRAAQAFR